MSATTREHLSRETASEFRHRLRTPLNHILGYSDMLIDEADSHASPELTSGLREISRLGREMLGCVSGKLEADNAISPEDLERFRRQLIVPAQQIAARAGFLVGIATDRKVLDILRIGSAAAELLEFAYGETSPSTRAPRGKEMALSSGSKTRGNVLIIDDDQANCDILERQLRRSGYRASVAKDGPEAFARLDKEVFDLVLVDFMMPGMSGLDVLHALKTGPKTGDIPVVMVSALDDLAGVSKCIEQGADDYIFKPYDPILLSARLGAALERRGLQAAERERTRQLERISQELVRSNEDLKRFAYLASHDLQAPLRTITTHLQLLERRVGKQLSDDDLELFHFAVDAAVRMNQLIKDLLTYSQLGTEDRVKDPVNCEEIIESTIDDLASEVSESGAIVTHDALPTLTGDPVLLRQLFGNLISNAIKYRREEEPPRIHIGVRRAGNGWQFSVRDNGLGIAPEYRNELFKLFRRLHGREKPGTGLGLAICKRILERIGGNIWVDSVENVGSTFHFFIPDEDDRAVPAFPSFENEPSF